MFKENFTKICAERGTSPTAVCVSIGLSSSVYSQWTETSMPRRTTLLKLADALGVTVDYLLGNDATHARVNTNEKKPADDGELSEAESALLDLFRSVDEDHQALVLQMIQAALNAKGLL